MHVIVRGVGWRVAEDLTTCQDSNRSAVKSNEIRRSGTENHASLGWTQTYEFEI